MEKYKFNLTIVGEGETIDDAFQNAIDSFCSDPEATIDGEVIYVASDKDEEKEIDN